MNRQRCWLVNSSHDLKEVVQFSRMFSFCCQRPWKTAASQSSRDWSTWEPWQVHEEGWILGFVRHRALDRKGPPTKVGCFTFVACKWKCVYMTRLYTFWTTWEQQGRAKSGKKMVWNIGKTHHFALIFLRRTGASCPPFQLPIATLRSFVFVEWIHSASWLM